MKRLVLLLAVAFIAGGAWFLYSRDGDGAATASVGYRTAVADRGNLVAQVTTAGTITPITTVIVGSQLSGQVVEILADYNSEVKTGQILARLNSDQIRARLDAARADLAQATAARMVQESQREKVKADIARANAVAEDMRAQFEKSSTQVSDAEKTLDRQKELAQRGIVSTAGLQTAQTLRDTLTAQRRSAAAQIASARAQIDALAAESKMLEAQMQSGEAQILQRSAVVRQIEVDLANTEIRSPVDGVVIQRNVELGQPVAASLQAPTLFLVAQDLRKVEIQANVDEADVGRVREQQDVSFSVNAYPGRTFQGVVKQVRLGSQTVQNVVIYTTMISVDNPALELRPGMTANLRILTERRENVVRVPNAALRWRPPANPDEKMSFALPGQGDTQASPAGPFTAPPEGGPPGGGRGGGGQFIVAMVDRMRGELRMTPEQITQLDAIIAELRAQAPPAGARPPQGGAGRGRELREALIEKINAILTPEQREKFRDLRQDMRADRGGRGQGAAGIPGRVYRLGPNGQPVNTPIRLGANDGAFTEVISGLDAGVPVIVGGAPPKDARGGLSGLRFGM